ncbi:DNA mismatch repair endonuclease MutL [Clostridium magnum]|uniref:DNA mismatch repair protein MutL n=1 Tax=Clostridium magnum DSM 2767 TaxID=1121326 RepID=A0A161YKS4_9CLOT|nr:DNA mismatch repair endonuclease MutL [Clostridium magnum]KZL91142.1 DNA mismatch repair protein MutL [Clostridium magnum DSM 2767]SHI17957.1 DNA mismatch repair protein MutL [Clostridium magnum DSM 2767]
MRRINLLDTETSNKIAAGEVVERPASVVKELLENSIDSKAKNIAIEILEGGQKSIKIIDDGHGIHPDDIEKAFMPHATSKISSIDDIYSIDTMGFRGEALPSIASVSNTVLRSRVEDIDFGREISISGGVVNSIQDAGCNVGTIIEVNDLFFNVPARQKFLKTTSREGSYISDIVDRLALANPDIAFKFSNNNKKGLNTYGTGKLIDVIRSVYGKSISENITSFEKHTDIASIHGYVGNSEISRGSRNNQSIFVNKRYIKNKLITAAVENAFKSFLTINKFPFFIVFLDIFPEFIDVNVHPTKSEIKFSDDRQIFKLTFDAVHEALRNSLKDTFNIPYGELPNIDIEKSDNELSKTEIEKEPIKTENIQLPIDLNTFSENTYRSEKIGNNIGYDSIFYEKRDDQIQYNLNNDSKKSLPNSIEIAGTSEVKVEDILREQQKEVPNTQIREANIAKFPPFNVIGQFHSTYILAQWLDTLYLIDQHAAHEKILFEKYKKSIIEHNIMSQVLITPIVIELTRDEYGIYIENSETFINTGFNIEIFGDNTISIREVPFILGKPNVRDLFIDILNNLKNMGSGETWEVKYNTIAKLACKAAIKANDNLSNVEMKSLIEDLRFIDDPFTCPHGRPTIIKFTLTELEKKFKRIQ